MSDVKLWGHVLVLCRVSLWWVHVREVSYRRSNAVCFSWMPLYPNKYQSTTTIKKNPKQL
jgi:hypothetical protein